MTGVQTCALPILDGLKLDFVDCFYYTEASGLQHGNGRDYMSVEEAVDRLLKDALMRLRSIKPDIMVEFRQSYIGPLMRTYGNMFRAADVPNDSLGNRIRTLDIRLLCGNTAAHSDMLMWNCSDSVVSAAVQVVSVLYSVPQISVLLDKIPDDHYKMLRYWMSFWRENRDVLLDGTLVPYHPEANYSSVIAYNDHKLIAAAYTSPVVIIPGDGAWEIILINGS